MHIKYFSKGKLYEQTKPYLNLKRKYITFKASCKSDPLNILTLQRWGNCSRIGAIVSWRSECPYVVKHPWSFSWVFLLYQKPRLVLSQGTSALLHTDMLACTHVSAQACMHTQECFTFSKDPDFIIVHLHCGFDSCLVGFWKNPGDSEKEILSSMIRRLKWSLYSPHKHVLWKISSLEPSGMLVSLS